MDFHIHTMRELPYLYYLCYAFDIRAWCTSALFEEFVHMQF